MNFQLSILKIVVHVEVEVEVEFSNDVSWYMCINYTREKSGHEQHKFVSAFRRNMASIYV